MKAYDPKSNICHYPSISMAQFGLNPYNEPLYRIVRADSRRYLVVGEWPDGSFGPEWVPLYKTYKGLWIMERWQTPERFVAGKHGRVLSRSEWELYYPNLGPYPDRGEYEFCHAFETSSVEDANLRKLVSWIEHSEKTRLMETYQWHKDDAERETKANQKQAEDLIRSKLPAYGCRPMFAAGTNRGTEKVWANVNQRYSANELGLPTSPGISTRRVA